MMKTEVSVCYILCVLLCLRSLVNPSEYTEQCDNDIVLTVESDSNYSVEDISKWENGMLEIDLSKFSSIESLCKPFDARQAKEVKLDGIGLKYLKPGVFDRLTGPFSLDLSHNGLQYIEDETFNDTDISSLDLRHNKINGIARSAFDNMKHLQVIYLDHNQIEGWHSEWFTNSPNVREVHIGHNLLSSLPANALRNVKGCHVVNNAQVLSSVDFSHNRIAALQEEAFADNKVFGDINLDGNSLTSISPKVFEHFDYLDSVTLNSNPMTCPSVETFQSLSNVYDLQWKDTKWEEVSAQCWETYKASLENIRDNSHRYEVLNEECV